MNSLVRITRQLAILLRRKRYRSELDEEMAFHRAQAERDLRADGMKASQARQAVNREFGNPEWLKERSHEIVAFRFETVTQDLRFAFRQLRKNPGFAATAIAILALGIGASVAIFGFVDAALIKPLPYANPTRLAMLYEGINLGPRFHLSYLDYLDWKSMNQSFQSLDVFSASGAGMLKTPQGPLPADGTSVTTGFFRTLGVTPVLGRDFQPSENAPSAPRTVLLSYGVWQQQYGGRRDVIGQTIVLNENNVTIIGVLPKGFHFAPAEPADYWLAMRSGTDCAAMRACHDYFGVGRLKDGVSFAAAAADMKSISERLEKEYPNSNRDRVAVMLPLTEVIVGDIRPVLLVLLGGSGLLLLIAGVNVASLLLVRSESRRREIAVRGALGASAGRLLRQFVTEGLLLALAGGVLGVATGVEAMRLLTQLVPKEILATMPYLQNLRMNSHTAIFATVVCATSGVLFALTPTLRLSLKEMRQGLTEGARGSAGTIWRRFGVNLVVIEIATAMVLLAGAGLLGKSLYRLLHADAGLEPDHLALLRVAAVGNTYQTDAQAIALERAVVAQVENLPGVKSLGVTSDLPLGDGDGATSFHRLDRPYLRINQEVTRRSVSPATFPRSRRAF